MIGDTPEKHTIEPFDPDRHDRTAFCCGVEQVDNFLKKTANKLASADNARVYVMTTPDGIESGGTGTASTGTEGAGAATVVGFYALNAHAIDYRDLPRKYARTRPAHGAIPAAFLSMIAVDQRFSGKGYGGDLLVDALLRVTEAAERVGISVIILDVLDDGKPALVARRAKLYAGYGFQPLPSNPLRMFLPIATVRKLLDEGEGA